MNINYRKEADITIAEIEGNLDTISSPDAETSLNKAIDDGANKLLIDFHNLTFISSAGLRTLLGLAKRQKNENGKLHLARMNETVKEVFVISGFDTIIDSSDSADEALRTMQD